MAAGCSNRSKAQAAQTLYGRSEPYFAKLLRLAAAPSVSRARSPGSEPGGSLSVRRAAPAPTAQRLGTKKFGHEKPPISIVHARSGNVISSALSSCGCAPLKRRRSPWLRRKLQRLLTLPPSLRVVARGRIVLGYQPGNVRHCSERL